MGTAAPGNFETAAFWNANVQALGNFVLSPPLFVAYHAGVQSVANNTFVNMLLDTEIIDTDGGHSTTTNSQRYTAQVAGVYEVNGAVSFTSGGTGIRGAKFLVNGVTSVPGSENTIAPAGSNASTVNAFTSYVRLAVGDYVSLWGYQNSGAALNTIVTGDCSTNLSARWVST